MAAYQHILVAIDLSDESSQVLDRAREEARLHGAKLSLVSVVKPMIQMYGGFGMSGDYGGRLAGLEAEVREDSRKRLAATAVQLGIPAERSHVLSGQPAHEIRQLAEAQGADLIVIGTHGQHGLGLLLGSTANAVLHGVQVDVLAVRVQNTKP